MGERRKKRLGVVCIQVVVQGHGGDKSAAECRGLLQRANKKLYVIYRMSDPFHRMTELTNAPSGYGPLETQALGTFLLRLYDDSPPLD